MNCRVLVVVVAFYSIANIFSVFFLSIFLYLFYFTWRYRMQFFPQFLRLSTLLSFFNMFSKLHVKLSPSSSQLPPYSPLLHPFSCQSTVQSRVLAQTIFRAAIKTQKFVQCAQFISVANTLDLPRQGKGEERGMWG